MEGEEEKGAIIKEKRRQRKIREGWQVVLERYEELADNNILGAEEE